MPISESLTFKIIHWLCNNWFTIQWVSLSASIQYDSGSYLREEIVNASVNTVAQTSIQTFPWANTLYNLN